MNFGVVGEPRVVLLLLCGYCYPRTCDVLFIDSFRHFWFL